MAPRSLTARLTVYFSLSSAAVLFGLGVFVSRAMDIHFEMEDEAALRENAIVIRRIVETSAIDQIPERVRSVMLLRPDVVIRMQLADGQALYTRGLDMPTFEGAFKRSIGAHQPILWEHDDLQFRGMVVSIPLPNDPEHLLDVFLGVNRSLHAYFLVAFQRTLALYIATAALLSGLFGWWAARRGLKPLLMMASRARHVTVHRLDERMPVDTLPREVAYLADTLNAMLDRLERDFRRLSDFSSDLAHELRTPISNLRTQTEVALSQPRNEVEYRDVLTANADELQRMARMVSDMLYLAKVENSLALPNVEVVQVANEIRKLFDFYDALAENEGIALELRGEVSIFGDKIMLRRALSNLLSNAIRHTSRSGHVRVSLSHEQDADIIHVDNDGEAVPAHLEPYIFERFFQVGPVRRCPESENNGLGLAITRAVIVAHGGSISVSRVGRWTRFSICLPSCHKPVMV